MTKNIGDYMMDPQEKNVAAKFNEDWTNGVDLTRHQLLLITHTHHPHTKYNHFYLRDKDFKNFFISLTTGIYYASAIIGPAIGYLAGGAFLSLYTDFMKLDTTE